MGVALNGANVIGYVKCRKDAGTKIRAMAGQFIGQQLMKQVFYYFLIIIHNDCVCDFFILHYRHLAQHQNHHRQ